MNSALETVRLILRPPGQGDVPDFVPLIGNFSVAKNLERVPHPYAAADGYRWLAEVRVTRANGDDYPFALIRKNDGAFIGVCSVHPARDFEFGYWLGEPFWGYGYATEAARGVAGFAFEELSAGKLLAGFMHDNPASGRVLVKLGFVPTHDAPYHSLARGQDVLGHRMVLTRERFESVNVRS